MQHHFDVDLATKYGMLEAVLLNHFLFWIKHNEANDVNFYEGRYWTFNSVKAFQELFPYVSERKIRYALERLKDAGLIQTGNFNTSAYVRTTWYAFTDKGNLLLQNYQMDTAILSNGNGKSVESIRYINNYTSIDTNINKDNKESVKVKRKQFTPPTLEEVEAYCLERNSPVDPKTFYDYFTAGEWKDSKGNPVLNWKQKLITWEKGRKLSGQSVYGNAQEHTAESKNKWDAIRYDN